MSLKKRPPDINLPRGEIRQSLREDAIGGKRRLNCSPLRQAVPYAGVQSPLYGHLTNMSFLTAVTPPTPRVTSTALLISVRELTKPVN